MKIHWDRLDKCNIGHNITDGFLFHDIVRVALMKLLRSRYKGKDKVLIYSEFFPESSRLPDIYLNLKGQEYIFEIQKSISHEWLEQTTKKYSDVNLIIVPLNEVMKDFIHKFRFEQKTFEQSIQESLEEYLI